MNREQNNQHLIEILQYLVIKYPDQRFGQILRNYGFIQQEGHEWKNEFYLESDELYKRVSIKFEEIHGG